MKHEYKYGIVALMILATVMLTFIFYEYKFDLPAASFFGVIIIAGFLFGDGFAEYCRGMTDQVLFNQMNGHRSIRHEDIHRIPWQGKTSDDTKKEKKPKIGETSIMFTGGINYSGISLRGGSDAPVLIFPSRYEGREQNSYHAYANLNRCEIPELPLHIQRILRYYKRRVKKNTPIYYGGTSHLDGTAIPENLQIEAQDGEENKELTNLQAINDRLYELLLKQKESDEKVTVMGQLVKPVDRE